MRIHKYDRVIEACGETHTINEWAEINKEKPVTIYNRWRRNESEYSIYTPGQIVGSEDLPQPKESKNIKPEVYKKRVNRKDTFDGSRMMLEFSRRALV